MTNKKILVIESFKKKAAFIYEFLEKEGFKITRASRTEGFISVIMNEEIDLVLLDMSLSKYEGWSICKEIRNISNMPVIILADEGEVFDEVYGFDAGADDYIKTPVEPMLLLARINAVLRRTTKKTEVPNKLLFNNIEINDISHSVKVCNKEVILSPKEYCIMLTLAQNHGLIVSREQILKSVWGYDYFGGLRTVDTHINRLRIKLGDVGETITTIRGFGYKFEG